MRNRLFGLKIVTLVLVSLGCATNGRNFPEPLVITFESSPGDTDIIVPALVNGRHKVRVIIDTGAGIEVLGKHLTENLGLKTHETHVGRRLNNDPMAIEMGQIESLSFGNITKKAWMVAPIAYFDEMSKEINVQGLISLKFFEDQAFTIDYPNRKVIIETQSSLEDRKMRGIRIPLSPDRQFSRALDVYVNLKVDDQHLQKAIVDTGSAPTKLPMEYFSKLKLNKNDPNLRKKVFNTIAGTKTEALFLPVPGRIQILGAESTKNDKTPVRFEERLRAGSIGGNFFAKYEVTFDLPNSELILIPRK